MAGRRRFSASTFSIGNCKVEIEGNDFIYESNKKNLLISVSEAAKIKIYVRSSEIDGDTPMDDCYFLLINPKDVDSRTNLLLKKVLNLYKKELPMMNYAANTGKESAFLERCVLSGKYRTLLMKSHVVKGSGEVIAAVSFQIISSDTQYAEIPLAAVSSNYHHKGIGHLLYMELRKRLHNVGVSTIFCWGDQESEGFWLKQGFISIAEVDTKGRAGRLPIKADIRRALCFPGGSTLMVSHLAKEFSIPAISPKQAKSCFPLDPRAKPPSSECFVCPEIDLSKDDNAVNLITDQLKNHQSKDLLNDGCSMGEQKVYGSFPISDKIKGRTDLVPLNGVDCNNVASDLGIAENGCNADVKHCSCYGQGEKKRVWEASLYSLKSKKVKGGHHIDCHLEPSWDLVHENDCKNEADFGGRSLDYSGDISLVKITPKVSLQTSCFTVHAEGNRPLHITSTEDHISEDPPLERAHPVIMLMNIADDIKKASLRKIVEELGGVVTLDGSVCTHVVTGIARRTMNFCTALCSGAWVISSNWLKTSFRESRFVGELPFILKDEDYVLKYRSELKDAVLRAKARPHALLKGYDFCLGPHVQPPVDILMAIVKSAGGNLLHGLDEVQKPSKTIFIACEEDMEEALAAAKKGVCTYTSDWIMNCVMRQELDLDAAQFAESL
ncbi:N-acetyltransferase isoform X2 [Tasmannia lanceolata]|uniref:N-acetyltransferase isoform X2 n=1 Tax=Tasmannia lanceolata TaxID=3420 RepID=UPI0040633166